MSILQKPFKYAFVNMTLILVMVNLGVFILTTYIWPELRGYLGLSVVGCLGLHFWFQPLTYMFVHSGWQHLFFNMVGLFCFGIQIERAIGSKEFALFYFLCGILDGLASLAVYYVAGFVRVLLVGASGAIYSLLLAYAVFFPRNRVFIWGILPVPAPLLVLLYAAIELGSQFAGRPGVAHLTHLTGFVLAWLYLVVRMGIHPLRIWKDAYGR